MFADRRLRALSGLAALGRFQDSVTILALLLGAQASGFSLADASLASAALVLAAGFSSTLKAGFIDRRGMRRAVGVLSLATLGGYAALLAALWSSDFPALLAAAALLGAVRVNAGMCMQVTWLEALGDDGLRARAASWENLVNNCVQSLGPLLLAALIAVFNPWLALALLGLAVSVSMFCWSRSSLHKPPLPAEAFSWPGLSIGWGVLSLATVGMCVNFLLGGLQVMVVGEAGAISAAVLLASLAAGTGAASLYSVARGYPLLSALPYAVALGIVGLVLVLPLLTALPAALLLACLLLCGALFGLGNAAMVLLLQRRAPRARRAEAFGWRLTLSFSGLAAGQALAGQVLGVWGGELTGLFFSAVGVGLLVYVACSMRLVAWPGGIADNVGLRMTYMPFSF